MQDIIPDFQKALARLQKAGEDVWNLVDKYSPCLALSVEETDDPIMALKRVRNVHANAVKICDALQSFADSWNLKTDDFAVKTDSLGLDIDSTARHRALSRLPDELLVDILDRAADTLKSSVRLSHVCKHFRRVLLWSSKHWTGHTLTSEMPSSLTFGIVERCGSGPFKAKIVFNRRILPVSDSVKAIVDLGPRLDDVTIHNSGVLGIRECDVLPLTFPEQGHALSPRTLTCQYCLPHSSLLRNVVNCTLDLEPESVKDLLEVSSSADKLEALTLRLPYGLDCTDSSSSAPISLPSLTTLRISTDGSRHAKLCLQFMEKIVPFTVSSLGFTSDIDPVWDFVNARPSIRDLRLEINLYDRRYLRYLPQQVETLELVKGYVGGTIKLWLYSPESFPAQNLRLLKLSDCSGNRFDILRLRDLFVRTGCDQVRFEFNKCRPMKNGVYELADVDKAIED